MNAETPAPHPQGAYARRWVMALLAVSALLYLAFFAFRPFSLRVLHETGTTPSAAGFFYATVAILLVELLFYAVCLRWMGSGSPRKKLYSSGHWVWPLA